MNVVLFIFSIIIRLAFVRGVRALDNFPPPAEDIVKRGERVYVCVYVCAWLCGCVYVCVCACVF